MSTKFWVILLTLVGGIVGGYLPTLFGGSFLSMWGILTSGVGAIIGLFIGLKLGD